MQRRVARYAAEGPAAVERRLGEISQGAVPSNALEEEERRALEALRQPGGTDELTTTEERADIHAFEDEGGRTTGQGEVDGSDRHDRAATDRALREAQQ